MKEEESKGDEKGGKEGNRIKAINGDRRRRLKDR